MLLSTFGIAPQAKVTNPLKGSFVTAVPSAKQITTALWQSMLIEQRPLVKIWKSEFTSWK